MTHLSKCFYFPSKAIRGLNYVSRFPENIYLNYREATNWDGETKGN